MELISHITAKHCKKISNLMECLVLLCDANFPHNIAARCHPAAEKKQVKGNKPLSDGECPGKKRVMRLSANERQSKTFRLSLIGWKAQQAFFSREFSLWKAFRQARYRTYLCQRNQINIKTSRRCSFQNSRVYWDRLLTNQVTTEIDDIMQQSYRIEKYVIYNFTDLLIFSSGG